MQATDLQDVGVSLNHMALNYEAVLFQIQDFLGRILSLKNIMLTGLNILEYCRWHHMSGAVCQPIVSRVTVNYALYVKVVRWFKVCLALKDYHHLTCCVEDLRAHVILVADSIPFNNMTLTLHVCNMIICCIVLKHSVQ
jgi:hypothetical protein